MNRGIGRYTSKFFSKPLKDRKQTVGRQDYKAKLWSTPVDDSEAALADERTCPYADQIRHVIGDMENGVAFQSLAVASLQTLQTVLTCEKQAAEAAISLAQGEKLADMIGSSEATAEAIAEALDAQGAHMLNFTPPDAPDEDGERSWWFTLTESIQAIEDGTNRILSLAAGQPKGGPGRKLSAIVVRLLRRQHQQLLVEADAWIS